MPNPYFSFKKFTISQELCAMKVGTDGVLLGAWASVSGMNALDIGTGTGLIALMMAQRNLQLEIDAIDIDEQANRQAEENVRKSPFNGRITCHRYSLQDYAEIADKKFDTIVSNPPFFTRSLKSPDTRRTMARHNDSLYAEDLIRLSSGLLSDAGKLSLIYPLDYKKQLFEYAALNNLSISRITNVYPTISTPAKRILIELSKQKNLLEENDLIIEKERHIYSEEFTNLVKNFYLKL